MDPDSYPQRAARGPRLHCKSSLGINSSSDGIGAGRERHKEAVSLGAMFEAAMGGDRGAHYRAMRCQGSLVFIGAERRQQASRALDVRKQESSKPGGWMVRPGNYHRSRRYDFNL